MILPLTSGCGQIRAKFHLSMPGFDFASWPPQLSQVQLEELTVHATSYALSHGLLYLPPVLPLPSVPSAAIHAPLSLFPSPLPRRLFEQAKKLQEIYNVLYSRVALDEEFLDRVMGAEHGVGKVDDFTGQLWKGWKALRDEGINQAWMLCSVSSVLFNNTTRVEVTPGNIQI